MFKEILSGTLVAWLLLSYSSISAQIVDEYQAYIDRVVDQLNSKQLEVIDTRIDTIYDSGVSLSIKQDRLLQYLDTAIEAKITGTRLTPKTPIQDTVKNSSITQDQQKRVTEKILEIQQNIFNKLQEQNITWLEEYLRAINVEEKWDLSFDIDISHESLWEFSADIKLEDYTAITSGFDNQLTAHMSTSLFWNDIANAWEFHMSAFLDSITKDGNLYLLLDELNIDSNTDQLQDLVDWIEKIAQQNNHILIEDNDESQEAIAFLTTMWPNLPIDEIQQVFEQPLLRAEKKIWDRYILVPTKYACDQGKLFLQKFDPFFGWDNCSTGQYEDLLQDFTQKIELYVILWDTTTFGWEIDDDTTNIKFEIDDDEISGEFHISEGGQELFTMTINGTYASQLFDINAQFEIPTNLFPLTSTSSGENINGELKIVSDTTNKRNNLNIFFNTFLDDKDIIRATLVNTTTRIFKETNIENPLNAIPYEEVFWEGIFFYQ